MATVRILSTLRMSLYARWGGARDTGTIDMDKFRSDVIKVQFYSTLHESYVFLTLALMSSRYSFTVHSFNHMFYCTLALTLPRYSFTVGKLIQSYVLLHSNFDVIKVQFSNSTVGTVI